MRGMLEEDGKVSCSDSTIRRIKAACLLSANEYGNKDAREILSIIYRLEAAEAVASYAKPWDCPTISMENWHKECGK